MSDPVYHGNVSSVLLINSDERSPNDDSPTAKRSPSNDGSTPTSRKKRRTKIKTCLFCREKKLKCDKRKPRCSSCVSRNLSECVYLDKTSSGKACDMGGNNNPIKVVKDNPATASSYNLEKEYNIAAEYAVASYERNSKDVNPLSGIFHCITKDSGRTITYGPTSSRCFGHKGVQLMMDKTNSFWHTMKRVRKKWKVQHDFSTLKELKSIEYEYEADTSLLTEVCKVLPSYNMITTYINIFFSETDLFPYSNAFDQEKILNDFYECFIPDTDARTSPYINIKEIRTNTKKNYYKAAVIIMILTLTTYYSSIPEPIERFLMSLNGSSMAKIFYVERSQFLLLRIIHRIMYISDGGDSSTLFDLRSSLCSNAIMIGLNRDIKVHFSHYKFLAGSVESLENLWIWTLYYDFHGALEIGLPMFVSIESFNEFNGTLDDDSKTFMAKLKRYLKIVRPMLRRTLSASLKPDFLEDENVLLTFIEEEFPPIEHFINEKKFQEIELTDVMIVASAVSFLICNYCIRFAYLKEHTLNVKGGFTKSSLFTYYFSVNSLLRCYEMDKVKYPQMLDEKCRDTTPYIALAMTYTSSPLRRGLISSVVATHFKLTVMSDPPIFLSRDGLKLDLKLDTLRANENTDFSLSSAFEKQCKIFDKWATPENPMLHKILCRSHCWVVCTTLERIGRRILQKILNHRYLTENKWFTKNSKNIEAILGYRMTENFHSCCRLRNDTVTTDDATIDSNKDSQTNGDNSLKPSDILNLLDQSNSPITSSNSTATSTSNDAGQEVNYIQPTAQNIEDISKLIDDFWKVYNAGFENVFENDKLTSDTDDYDDLSMFDNLNLFK